MLKLLGAILVITSSAGIGLYLSSMTRGRLSDLKEFKKNIVILRGDIRYGSTPLPEAIETVGYRCNDNFKPFFEGINEDLRKQDGSSFCQMWDKATKEYMGQTYLNQKDKANISKLGDNLGYLDKEMQVKTIDLFLEQMELEITEATDTIKDKTRLYNMLGVLGGIFVTIVLI